MQKPLSNNILENENLRRLEKKENPALNESAPKVVEVDKKRARFLNTDDTPTNLPFMSLLRPIKD